ncbi:hypothetical protein [Micromonospora sp. 15K316]|uniref:hypothetical protein n=1 Tax=Micromonospora sp. 15K316 TaxID=2530376 RepID=UPI001FB5D910|nr:hypothetical protein [Micromonospora sp. 15K316]
MKRRPRDIGTAAESATVKFLVANGFPHAERRSLRASDLVIEKWMAELAVEVTNARAMAGILVVQRAGVGPANAGRWWAYTTSAQLAALTGDPYPTTGRFGFPVRMLLADAVTLLRAAGYGEPEARPVVAPYDGTRHDDIENVPFPGLEAVK